MQGQERGGEGARVRQGVRGQQDERARVRVREGG